MATDVRGSFLDADHPTTGSLFHAGSQPDLGEADISASLTQFDDMWKALIPAEQARVVRLLVARVTASEAGLAVDLRHEGLGAIASLMVPAKSELA